MLPEDLGFTGFLDRKEKHNKAIEAAKVARLTAAEGRVEGGGWRV